MGTTHPSPFGSLLKRYRIAAGLTQEELAERARLSARAVSDLERGAHRSPYRDTLQQLAHALDLDNDDLRQLEQAARVARGRSSIEKAPAREQIAGNPLQAAGIRAVLIADIRGYTGYTEEHGDKAAARLASRFAMLTEEVVAAHHGDLVELRGDEALCIFSSARDVLRAAVALQTAFRDAVEQDPSLPLHVGMGLDAGETIPVKGGYRGGALNLAARLCALAGAGEVFCSEGVIHLARRTEGITFVDRGEVVLKGLPYPVRVIQIAPEGELPDSLPPLQPILVTHPTNLPDEPTPFIGRKQELEHITRLLQEPHSRLVTLTGQGGTGKTRLALQAGSTLLHTFQDGVFFVSLAPLVDPALVPSTVAGVLGVKEEAGKDLVESLGESLRKKNLLLLLDNFEHLLDASSVVATLLDRCRDLRIVVTSRIPLHLSREQEYAVPPLTVPDPAHLPDPGTLSQYESVALFIDRSRAVKANFEVTNENAPAIAEICYRLDGLPLAIELAAARIKLFPPQALLLRLSSRLTLLTGGAKDRPTRQQTLRGAIDWSYSLLSPEDQILFARLSVFGGGCTFEAAGAICAPNGDLDLLEGITSLVDKSLLLQEGEDEPRFVMLETIREYASERLEEVGGSVALKDEHTRYYLVLAEEAASRTDLGEQVAWLERIEVERDNLRAALLRSRESGDADRGLRLALALQGFWIVRGPLGEGRRWLEDFAAAEAGAMAARAAALSAASKLAAAEGRLRDAGELAERSLVLYGQLGDQTGRAELVGRLAQSLVWSGEVRRADDLLRQTEIEGRETGNQRLLAMALRFQAALAEERRAPQRSRLLGEESLLLYRNLEDGEGIADVLRILADAAYGAGDRERARALVDELLALLQRAPPGMKMEEWLQPLAYRARMLGDYAYATRILDQLVARAEAMGDRRIASHARTGLGLLAREQGDYVRAAQLYGESVAVLQEVGDLLGRCRALVGLSDVARDQGDGPRVIALCEETLPVLQETGDVYLTGFVLHNLGLAAWYQGDRDRAERLFDEALSRFRNHQAAADALEVRISAGLLALDAGQYDRARAIFAECLATARESEIRWLTGTLLEGMAGVAASQDEAERAARLFGAAEAERQVMNTPLWPAHQSLCHRCLARARTALGQEHFLHALEQGRAMTLDQALAFALDEVTLL